MTRKTNKGINNNNNNTRRNSVGSITTTLTPPPILVVAPVSAEDIRKPTITTFTKSFDNVALTNKDEKKSQENILNNSSLVADKVEITDEILKNSSSKKSSSTNEVESTEQLEIRLKKIVSLLVKHGSSSDPVPSNMPTFLSNAISAVRSISLPLILENQRLASDFAELEGKLDSVLPFLEEVNNLRERLCESEVSLKDFTIKANKSFELLTTFKRLNNELIEKLNNSQNSEIKLQESLKLSKKENEILLEGLKQLELKQSISNEQILNLQHALKDMELTRTTESQYELDAMSRSLDIITEREKNTISQLELSQKANEELRLNLISTEALREQLSREVHNLTDHIQKRLIDIAQTHEIDRQLLANWIVQFLTFPNKRETIVHMMSATLGFTEIQKQSVEEVIFASPLSASLNNNGKSRFPMSEGIVDKWVSFLLKEVHKEEEEVVVQPKRIVNLDDDDNDQHKPKNLVVPQE